MPAGRGLDGTTRSSPATSNGSSASRTVASTNYASPNCCPTWPVPTNCERGRYLPVLYRTLPVTIAVGCARSSELEHIVGGWLQPDCTSPPLLTRDKRLLCLFVSLPLTCVVSRTRGHRRSPQVVSRGSGRGGPARVVGRTRSSRCGCSHRHGLRAFGLHVPG